MQRRLFLKSGIGAIVSQQFNQAALANLNLPAATSVAVRICEARVEFYPQKLITPLQLSTGTIREVTEARATVTIELSDNSARSEGYGSIYLSDLWAWPDSELGHDRSDAVLRGFCEKIAAKLPSLLAGESQHPLEVGLLLHDWACHQAEVSHDPPLLAKAMCASPFDAAIHDATGVALQCSAFQLYQQPAEIPSADRFFPGQGAVRAIASLLQEPKSELPAWWIVNKSDDLATTLRDAIRRSGYCCFKLKITGRDCAADVQRTSEVFRVAKHSGVESPRITVDSNEANPDAASVAAFLEQLAHLDADAYNALDYLEQPTGRDIYEHKFDWHEIGKIKPVMLDEGLTDLSILSTARVQGWSGLALKTCKGHSMLLTAAAWGNMHGMKLSLQDLTNPGIALIHAALVGAYLPTINGVELNSPQFTPAANERFLPRLSSLFEPMEGVHRLTDTTPVGLGSRL